MGYKQADTFANTTREIAEYVGREYLDGGDTKRSIEQMKNPVLTRTYLKKSHLRPQMTQMETK